MNGSDYDYIIIGSGIAGLNTALLARKHGSVLVITKGAVEDCNTRYAQGGIAAAVGPGDSPSIHFGDTMAAGAGLCDPESVGILTQEGPRRVADLIEWGVPFDSSNGTVSLGQEAAHSLPRILHAGGDATGRHIEVTLAALVADSGVAVLDYTLATRLLVEKRRAAGVETIHCATGRQDTFTARSVVIATGGGGQLFQHTTNPAVATGDGVALAYRAGARVMDMEFFQLHPTALMLEGAPTFLLSEAMRGEGAILRKGNGDAFMADYHPLGDLAPRDVVSRAIASEMGKPEDGKVFLDITHLPPDRIRERFPTIHEFCLAYGLDITRDPAPVAPAAHYMMGGVQIDTWGRTTIPGLYACGEAACSAVHGANRLASNSLLDTLVFAPRVVSSTRGEAPDWEEPGFGEDVRASLQSRPQVCATMPAPGREALQDLMWRNAGINRRGTRLLLNARILNAWDRTMPEPTTLDEYELSNMTLVGRLMVEAALLRKESRGSHYREDFPETSTDWKRHIVLGRDID